MYKKLSYIFLSMILTAVVSAECQNIRFTHLWNHTNFGFDLNKAWSYNNYEHNRWGGGLYLNTPLKYDKRYGTDFQNSFISSAYIGYGAGDEAWKWGARAGLSFPRWTLRGVEVNYMHDLERVGDHSLSSYNIWNTTDNNVYFSSWFSFVDRISASVKLDLPGSAVLNLEYRHSEEQLLFDSTGLLYPQKDDADIRPKKRYDEAHITLEFCKDWTLDFLGGYTKDEVSDDRVPIGRVFLQYKHSFKLKGKWGTIGTLAQVGTTLNDDTPLPRRFDLSGTGGSWYYFRNTFLTVNPNQFMADQYVEGWINWKLGKTIWNTSFSKPSIFMQAGGMWGYSKTLTAPDKGLFEMVVGIDGLVRWGLVDMGVAAAAQMTPEKASYHLDNFLDGVRVMFVAKLVFEDYIIKK